MKYLNLNDLKFDSLNYSQKGYELRNCLLKILNIYPATYREISVITNIPYQVLLNFIHARTSYMSYKYMFNLRMYIKKLNGKSKPY